MDQDYCERSLIELPDLYATRPDCCDSLKWNTSSYKQKQRRNKKEHSSSSGMQLQLNQNDILNVTKTLIMEIKGFATFGEAVV